MRAEGGTKARVVEAKKVRNGGIGGFFAKERFVVTAELPDEGKAKRGAKPAAPAPDAIDERLDTVAPPSSILELADLVDEQEERLQPMRSQPAPMAAPEPMTAPEPAPVPTARATARAVALQSPTRAAARAAALDAALGAAEPMTDLPLSAPPFTRQPSWQAMEAPPILKLEDYVEVQPAVQVPVEREAAPLPSTEGSSFQEVLLRLAAQAEGAAVPTRDAADDVDDLDGAAMDLDDHDFEMDDLADLEELTDDLDVVDEPMPTIERPAATAVVPSTTIEQEDPAVIDDMLPAVSGTKTLTRVRKSPTMIERSAGFALLEMGVPASYVPDIHGAIERDDLRDAVATALRIPKPPALPMGDHAVIAIVGERRAALELAERLADEPALNGAIVTMADRAGFELPEAGGMTHRRAGRRLRASRNIVVVPSTPGATGKATRQVLDQLDPELVYGVVPATRKCEDVASWALDLGGLDALALTELDSTVSPAAVLRLGIPVARLDGEVATREAWADLLVDRIAIAA